MMTPTVYRTRTIKRRRRTQAEVGLLDDQICAALAADHPQSVRHIFYRMTDPRLAEPVEKSERGYRHVQDRITKLRREGRLPYGWIADATRRGHFVDTFTGASDFIARTAAFYRADLWEQTDHYVEVWTESRSIAGVIQSECNDLAVTLYPCGGFSSITLAYEAAEHMNAVHAGRLVSILYIGDYDPAGVLIDVSLERELRTHLDADVDLAFERIAITEAQIETYGLPTKPRKDGDRRAREIQAKVEAEAMPAEVLRKLLRSRVEALLPPEALRLARVAEASERKLLWNVAAEMQGGA